MGFYCMVRLNIRILVYRRRFSCRDIDVLEALGGRQTDCRCHAATSVRWEL